jgi:hypothetical protein
MQDNQIDLKIHGSSEHNNTRQVMTLCKNSIENSIAASLAQNRNEVCNFMLQREQEMMKENKLQNEKITADFKTELAVIEERRMRLDAERQRDTIKYIVTGTITAILAFKFMQANNLKLF